jgi:hypothetical protein
LTQGKDILAKIEKVLNEAKNNLAAVPPQPKVDPVFLAVQKARGETLIIGFDALNRIRKIEDHMLKSHNIPLSNSQAKQALQEFETQLGQAKTLKDIEQLKKPYLLEIEKIEIELSRAIAPKMSDPFISNMLKEIAYSLAQNSLQRKVVDSGDHVDIVDGLDVELPMIHQSAEKGIEPHQVWQYKQWGLILASTSTSDSVLNLFRKGFVQTVDFFQQQKMALKEQLSKMDLNDPQRANIEKQLVEVKRELYPVVLQRMIDMVSEKEWEMRVLKKHLNPSTEQLNAQSQLRKELQVLNDKFYNMIVKYKELPMVESKGIAASLASHARDEMMRVAFLGYEKPSYSNLMHQKRYADMGYSMTHYLEEWTAMANKSQMDPVELVKNELMGFVTWAGKHPNKATTLAGDIALAVKLTGDASFAESYHSALKAKAYSRAFFAPLGGPDWEEVEVEQELKYRALADLARLIPLATSATKNVAEEFSKGNLSIVSLLVSAASGAVKARIIQRGYDIVPAGTEQIVAAATSIMRGEDIKKILEDQRNIELVRLGGMAQKILFDPLDFLNSAGTRVKIWMRSFGKSVGNEKLLRIATQILVPTVTVAGCGAIIAVVALGGPVTWAAALAVILSLLTFSFSLTWKANSMLNAWYPNTIKKIKDELLKESTTLKLQSDARESAKNKLMAENRVEIETTREGLIKDLIAARQLPYIRPPENKVVDQTTVIEKNRIKIKLKGEYLAQLNQSYLVTKDPITSMKQQFNVDELIAKIHKQLNETIAAKVLDLDTMEKNNLAGLIGYELVAEVMNDWLRPKLDNQLVERALDQGASLSVEKLKALEAPDEETMQENAKKSINKRLIRQLSTKFPDARIAAAESAEIWDQNLIALTERDALLYKPAEAA